LRAVDEGDVTPGIDHEEMGGAIASHEESEFVRLGYAACDLDSLDYGEDRNEEREKTWN
jgi:hypothetical protein